MLGGARARAGVGAAALDRAAELARELQRGGATSATACTATPEQLVEQLPHVRVRGARGRSRVQGQRARVASTRDCRD